MLVEQRLGRLVFVGFEIGDQGVLIAYAVQLVHDLVFGTVERGLGWAVVAASRGAVIDRLGRFGMVGGFIRAYLSLNLLESSLDEPAVRHFLCRSR